MPAAKQKPPEKQRLGDKQLERKWEECGSHCNAAARSLLGQGATTKEIGAMAKEISRAVERMKNGTSVQHVKAVKSKCRNGRLPA